MEYNLADIVTAISYVISAAAVIAAMFPKAEKANRYIQALRKIIDALALNIGNAKNK